MLDLNLATIFESWPESATVQSDVPLACEADFQYDNYYRTLIPLPAWEVDGVIYHNAATCPDCGGAMIRQGRCCVCPSCGFESCLVR